MGQQNLNPQYQGLNIIHPHLFHQIKEGMELTVVLHGAAVNAAPQPWLFTEGRGPAGVAVAVLVAVADLGKDS